MLCYSFPAQSYMWSNTSFSVVLFIIADHLPFGWGAEPRWRLPPGFTKFSICGNMLGVVINCKHVSMIDHQGDALMTDKLDPSSIPILNPRYKGATPEDVGRALLRRRPVEELPENQDETQVA